ncbi:MAG: hypothetical protein MJ165_00760 [Alphaproteobacteria bacterium]|nr:hypothetical protein [Alphaproteobacteria bacterium]
MNITPYVYDKNDIVWHPNQKYTYAQYHQALNEVFDWLYFKNAENRFNLIGSYRMNLRNMVLYAVENNIDEIEYIKSLRTILAKDAGCVDLQRGM